MAEEECSPETVRLTVDKLSSGAQRKLSEVQQLRAQADKDERAAEAILRHVHGLELACQQMAQLEAYFLQRKADTGNWSMWCE